jgi:hypothetical protein
MLTPLLSPTSCVFHSLPEIDVHSSLEVEKEEKNESRTRQHSHGIDMSS